VQVTVSSQSRTRNREPTQVSVRTVEVHVDHILTKLSFRTRTQLAAWAHEEGMLTKDT